MPLVAALPAVQRGTVDGVRSGIVIFVPFKYWTISKQMTEIGDSFIVPITFISVRWWKTLPMAVRVFDESAKQVLSDAGVDASECRAGRVASSQPADH